MACDGCRSQMPSVRESATNSTPRKLKVSTDVLVRTDATRRLLRALYPHKVLEHREPAFSMDFGGKSNVVSSDGLQPFFQEANATRCKC